MSKLPHYDRNRSYQQQQTRDISSQTCPTDQQNGMMGEFLASAINFENNYYSGSRFYGEKAIQYHNLGNDKRFGSSQNSSIRQGLLEIDQKFTQLRTPVINYVIKCTKDLQLLSSKFKRGVIEIVSHLKLKKLFVDNFSGPEDERM